MEPCPDIISQIIERAASPGYDAWWSRVEHAGYCSSPVELRGRSADGESVTILARCKNRRASVCPSCSALYSGDTWQLVHQGIASGVEADGGRPMVFTTLTAPGFGAVHSSSRADGRCRPGAASSCAHGRSVRCSVMHRPDDPRLGEPLCPECYDYFGHALFTWHAPQLWHRFTVGLRRAVDQRLSGARVSYVKVVELQRRGIPHFHAVIRLDGASPAISSAELAALIHRAASSVRLVVPSFGGELATLRFGSQTDVQPLRFSAGQDNDRRVASYLAKYVTKSVADFGLGPRRISPRAVATLAVRLHVREILWTVLALADSPGPPEMAKWLHTLGYRGHITTKTRTYSTTMGALRAHRAEWRTTNSPEPSEASAAKTSWRFIQVGHRNEGERLLATTADAATRTSRLAAREELACRPDDGWGL